MQWRSDTVSRSWSTHIAWIGITLPILALGPSFILSLIFPFVDFSSLVNDSITVNPVHSAVDLGLTAIPETPDTRLGI